MTDPAAGGSAERGWVHVGFGPVSLADAVSELEDRLAGLSDGEAAIVDLTAVHKSDDSESVGHDVRTLLSSAASRGLIVVVAATDEAVRLELIRCNVDRIAPIRFDLADAQVILERMISI